MDVVVYYPAVRLLRRALCQEVYELSEGEGRVLVRRVHLVLDAHRLHLVLPLAKPEGPELLGEVPVDAAVTEDEQVRGEEALQGMTDKKSTGNKQI